MPRIDDYRKALELAKADLLRKNPKRIAEGSGAELRTDSKGQEILTIRFLNRKVAIRWGEFDFSFEDPEGEVPIQQQILLLHYMGMAETAGIAHEWISYQEVPDGRFYLDAFVRRAKNPLIQTFGNEPELLVKLATETYGARPLDHGDFSVVIQALPLVPVALILWKGDEEFPPDGNILFDRSISKIFSAEDIAWLAGMIIYPLAGKAHQAR